MIVTVKNEVNEPEVRLRAHRNKGLREPSSGSTRDKAKIVFFEPEIWDIPTIAHRSRARIDPFAFSSLAAWECKRIRFNGDISTVRFISTTSTEPLRATLEHARARASSHERAAELGTFVSVFFFRLFTKLKHDHNRTTIHDFNLHQ